MRSLLRKSTIIFISFLLVCLCAFVEGCASENDGFIYVSSITFVSDGKTITKNSRCHHEYSTIDEITEEEYLNSPSEDRWPYGYETYQIQNKTALPPKERMGATTYRPPVDDGSRIYYYAQFFTQGPPKFYTVHHRGAVYEYIQVKILDNTTIIIKEPNKTTTYTVTSYSIKEFT